MLTLWSLTPEGCKSNFKLHSMQRWESPINNSTLKSLVWSCMYEISMLIIYKKNCRFSTKVNCSFLLQWKILLILIIKDIIDQINVSIIPLLTGHCNLCKEGQFKNTLAFPLTITIVKILILEKAEFSCDICYKGFNTARNLKNHKKRAHSVQMLTCAFCTKVFSR